jgi:hypothetical protein
VSFQDVIPTKLEKTLSLIKNYDPAKGGGEEPYFSKE